MSDAIEIRALRVTGHHGALPGEQDNAQLFEIDIVVESDFSGAISGDDLAQAVDYGHLIETASEIVQTRRFALLETLAEAIAHTVLAEPRVKRVVVAVRKVHPPLEAVVGGVGVRVERFA